MLISCRRVAAAAFLGALLVAPTFAHAESIETLLGSPAGIWQCLSADVPSGATSRIGCVQAVRTEKGVELSFRSGGPGFSSEVTASDAAMELMNNSEGVSLVIRGMFPSLGELRLTAHAGGYEYAATGGALVGLPSIALVATDNYGPPPIGVEVSVSGTLDGQVVREHFGTPGLMWIRDVWGIIAQG